VYERYRSGNPQTPPELVQVKAEWFGSRFARTRGIQIDWMVARTLGEAGIPEIPYVTVQCANLEN